MLSTRVIMKLILLGVFSNLLIVACDEGFNCKDPSKGHPHRLVNATQCVNAIKSFPVINGDFSVSLNPAKSYVRHCGTCKLELSGSEKAKQAGLPLAKDETLIKIKDAVNHCNNDSYGDFSMYNERSKVTVRIDWEYSTKGAYCP
ncbi:hypothetical protein BY996DRAFT_6409908 [Phakopsora pachyrhizi]|uniref:Expressed protein n=1 Tax=Phakopsora pachyrhizi TaxID=170000 RepID=A0A0S1MJE9_PHAPC|nr:hypothetical protein BY996DRAFT_6409908 [Phakopsora pachyrhizi]CAH7666904.1 expressed protein [Phakopsora pachyrhizi]